MCLFRLVILLLSCVVAFGAAAAGISCNDVPAIPGSAIGYHRWHNPERCEGFYQQEVGGTFELLSLVNGPINYDLKSDNSLIVSLPGSIQLPSSHVFLVARALRRETHYRMEAHIAPSEKFKWPLNEVLAPANLRSDSIGVVAWVNRAFGKYYVPVSVVPNNVAPSALRPPIMIFRSSLDIDRLRWRVRPEGVKKITNDWRTKHSPIIRAGEPIHIQIQNQPRGPSIVDVAASFVNTSMPEHLIFRVILP